MLGNRIIKKQSAFTHLDLVFSVFFSIFILLVIIAIHSNYHIKPDEIKCSMNIKKILSAIENYAEIHDRYPACASHLQMLTNDWIYWQPGRRFEDSPIGLVFKRNDLVCPIDENSRHRQYPFSYSMNSVFSGLSISQSVIKPEMLLILEEKDPNDGAFDPNQSEAIGIRHRHRTLAGRVDGAVESLTPRNAKQRLKLMPVIKEQNKR